MRLSYFDLTQARPELRPEFERLPDLRLTQAIAHAEDALLPHLRFGAALLTQTELEPSHRELAILRVAAVTGARYPRSQHGTLAARAGLTEREIEAVEAPELETGEWGERELLVLRFVDELLANDGASAASVAGLGERFSEREIVELILIVGRWRMVAMLVNALDIEPEAERADAVIAWARQAGDSSTRG